MSLILAPTSNAMSNNYRKSEGPIAFVLGVISIFYMSPVFVPLAIITGIVALFKKQFIWGVLAILCAVIGLLTSPILLAALGLTAMALNPHSFHFEYRFPKEQIHKTAPENRKQLIEIRSTRPPYKEGQGKMVLYQA